MGSTRGLHQPQAPCQPSSQACTVHRLRAAHEAHRRPRQDLVDVEASVVQHSLALSSCGQRLALSAEMDIGRGQIKTALRLDAPILGAELCAVGAEGVVCVVMCCICHVCHVRGVCVLCVCARCGVSCA